MLANVFHNENERFIRFPQNMDLNSWKSWRKIEKFTPVTRTEYGNIYMFIADLDMTSWSFDIRGQPMKRWNIERCQKCTPILYHVFVRRSQITPLTVCWKRRRLYLKKRCSVCQIYFLLFVSLPDDTLHPLNKDAVFFKTKDTFDYGLLTIYE